MRRISKVPMVNLGSTGLKVSKLGFGTFDFGVPSLNITPEEGGRVLVESYKLGVNFWDTSDDYDTQPHVAWALKHVPRQKVVICTKTSAKSGKEARRSLKKSLEDLGTNYVDIFLLHFVRSEWLDGCRRVLKELNGMKKAGIAKAIGLSTHSVSVVREISRFEGLDVIMTICCKTNRSVTSRLREYIPLEDGCMEEMFHAIQLAHSHGKGICAMKVLGNGLPSLVRNYRSSVKFIAQMGSVDTVVIGMRSLDEVIKNAKVISLGTRNIGN